MEREPHEPFNPHRVCESRAQVGGCASFKSQLGAEVMGAAVRERVDTAVPYAVPGSPP